MPKVIGIRFKPAGKIYYFDPSGFEDLEVGDYVVVETTKGKDIGWVVVPTVDMPEERIVSPLKGITRKATSLDTIQREGFKNLESEALQKCREKVKDYGFPMNVVKAEYNFDGSLLVFYFTSEERIDFRELLKDLSKAFDTKVELRQIGARDEAKIFGGLGRCGRPLCCITFLTEFHPISIKMAKDQDLPLSPTEISGLCGRLLCCLAYEEEYYRKKKEELPKIGEKVKTPYGSGKVKGINILKETIEVELESEIIIEVPAGEARK
jgi:cell fate regulator YaaT (PSP1 superfamily)